MDNTGFAFFLAFGAVGAAILLGPIGRALGRWIESKSVKAPSFNTGEIDLQREQTEALTQRVNELEERLDFAERLLTQQREADRIGKGGA